MTRRSSDSSPGELESGRPASSHLYPRIQLFLFPSRQFGLAAVAAASPGLLRDRAPRGFILHHLGPKLPLRGLPPPWRRPEFGHANGERAQPYAQERTDMLGPGPQLGTSRALGCNKGLSSRRVEEGTEGHPHTGLEAEIQGVGGAPAATALSVEKFFPVRHEQSTGGDPEQPLRGRGQRGSGSRAEACEE